MNLFKRAISQVNLSGGWQSVGYVTIVALSAISAIAFIVEYQAAQETLDISIEAPPVETGLE